MGVTAVEDASPSPDADAVLRRVSHALRRDTRLLEGILARVRPSVSGGPDAARFLAPVDDYLLVGPGLADSWDPDVHDGAARPLPPFDTARLTTLAISGRRVALRTAGLLHQLVTRAGRDPVSVLPELDRLIDEWCADYRDGYGARWIPVARQAEYQTRVVLAAFDLAARRPRDSHSGEGEWSSEPAVPMHRE